MDGAADSMSRNCSTRPEFEKIEIKHIVSRADQRISGSWRIKYVVHLTAKCCRTRKYFDINCDQGVHASADPAMAMRDKALSVITNCHGDGEQAYPDCNIDCLAGRGKLYVEGANEVLWRQIWGSAQNQIKDASIAEYLNVAPQRRAITTSRPQTFRARLRAGTIGSLASRGE